MIAEIGKFIVFFGGMETMMLRGEIGRQEIEQNVAAVMVVTISGERR